MSKKLVTLLFCLGALAGTVFAGEGSR